MKRYTTSWDTLTTSKLSETSTEIEYEAVTPGFSTFVIVAEKQEAADTVTEPSAVCGNSIKESGEDCDGSDFGTATCSSLGYDTGTLKCTSACKYDTSECAKTETTIEQENTTLIISLIIIILIIGIGWFYYHGQKSLNN